MMFITSLVKPRFFIIHNRWSNHSLYNFLSLRCPRGWRGLNYRFIDSLYFSSDIFSIHQVIQYEELTTEAPTLPTPPSKRRRRPATLELSVPSTGRNPAIDTSALRTSAVHTSASPTSAIRTSTPISDASSHTRHFVLLVNRCLLLLGMAVNWLGLEARISCIETDGKYTADDYINHEKELIISCHDHCVIVSMKFPYTTLWECSRIRPMCIFLTTVSRSPH